MLRNGRYKYNYYVGYPPELFDLAADPGEERNLARTGRARSRSLRDSRSSCAPCSIPKPRTPEPRLTRPHLIARFGGPEKACNVGAPGATPAPI